MDEGGRGLVEGVGVVDGHDVGRPGQQGLAGPGERGGFVDHGEEGCERTERDTARRPRRPHDEDAPAGGLGALDRLGQQPGLAHAGVADEHDAAARDRVHDVVQLWLTAHERPRQLHRDLLPGCLARRQPRHRT